MSNVATVSAADQKICPQTGKACSRKEDCARFNPSEFRVSTNRPTDSLTRAIRCVGRLVFPEKDGSGSLFVVGQDWILTAAHVLVDAANDSGTTILRPLSYVPPSVYASRRSCFDGLELDFSLHDRQAFSLAPSEGLLVNRKMDYALCRVNRLPDGRSIGEVMGSASAAKEPPAINSHVHLIGHSNTRLKQLRTGVAVAAPQGTEYADYCLAASPYAEDGFSGAGLFDNDGSIYALSLGRWSEEFRSTRAVPLDMISHDLAAQGFDLRQTPGLPPPGPRADPETILVDRKVPKENKLPPRWGPEALWRLPKALKKAHDAVGIIFQSHYGGQSRIQGTCVLIAPGWILTAHHVASSVSMAATLSVDFDFTVDREINQQYRVVGDPRRYFSSEDGLLSCCGSRYDLDYALLPIEPVNGSRRLAPIQKFAGSPTDEESIFIVGHPDSRAKGVYCYQKDDEIPEQFQPPENKLKVFPRDVGNPFHDNYLFHRAWVTGGMSGAPIFNADGALMGLHTHSLFSAAFDYSMRRDWNWGPRMSAIAADLFKRYGSLPFDTVPPLRSLVG